MRRRHDLRATPVTSGGFPVRNGSRTVRTGVRLRSRVTPAAGRPTSDVTGLLQLWSDGDRDALDRLVPLLYDQLRRLAHERMVHEEASPVYDTTSLVHEAYLKLVDVRQARFQDRTHFLAMASRVMRRLLVDYARERKAAKRGGGAALLRLSEGHGVAEPRAPAITELDDALRRLETIDPRQSQILEHRYFGGLSLEEIAEVAGVSLATVKRDLRFARAWLALELGAEPVG